MSSSVLNDRLAELRAAEALTQTEEGYRLTDEGTRLLDLYPPLHGWADRWAEREGAASSHQRRPAP